MAQTIVYITTMEATRANEIDSFNSRFSNIERLFEVTLAKWEQGMEILKTRIVDIKKSSVHEEFPGSETTLNH